MSSNFVDFLIDSNVEPAEATALGSSCVSKGQYLSLIIDYSAAENVDALFGEESTPINYKPFLRDAEIDGNNPANHRQDYWDSPAMIEGEPMSWNQMYESFIQPEGEPPLEMGKVIQDSVKRDSLNFVRDLYPERAAEGAYPMCDMLLSSVEQLRDSGVVGGDKEGAPPNGNLVAAAEGFASKAREV